MITKGPIPTMRAHVGARVRQLREEQGLSQSKFSAMIGMSRTYLNGIENGKKNPTLDSMCKIALGLGVSPYMIFWGIDVEMQEPKPRG